MPIVISMLRGVNVGGNHKIKMDALKTLYESLGLRDVQTYIQSGNVVFRSKAGNLAALGTKIEDAIEKTYGFRAAVILRTADELRAAIAGSPFAARDGMEAGKLLVTFLSGDPTEAARGNLSGFGSIRKRVGLVGRELHIYFPNGQGKTKLSMALIERTLQMNWTGRKLGIRSGSCWRWRRT